MNITDGTIKDALNQNLGLKKIIRDLRTEIEEAIISEAMTRTHDEKAAAKLLQISYSAFRYMSGQAARPKSHNRNANIATRKVQKIKNSKKRK